MQLRIHAFQPFSRDSGPGMRAVIWVQGCDQDCPGCYNWEMSDPTGGDLMAVDDLFQAIESLGEGIEGVSISGGEPLQQVEPLLALLGRIRQQTSRSTLLFTGYTWQEIQQMAVAKDLLACVDVLVAGPYDETQHLYNDLRSSANQTIHLPSGRYTPEDLQNVPTSEIIVEQDGDVKVSGADPV